MTRLISHTKEPISILSTDHESNIFQTKFLPYSSDRVIISAARDGLVSRSEIDETGSIRMYSGTNYGREIIRHSRSCHKICFVPQSPGISYL